MSSLDENQSKKMAGTTNYKNREELYLLFDENNIVRYSLIMDKLKVRRSRAERMVDAAIEAGHVELHIDDNDEYYFTLIKKADLRFLTCKVHDFICKNPGKTLREVYDETRPMVKINGEIADCDDISKALVKLARKGKARRDRVRVVRKSSSSGKASKREVCRYYGIKI